MSNSGGNSGASLINLGDISKPATVLIEKISEAVGGVFRPHQIRRVAQAEADAERIRAISRIEVTDLERRALQRFVQEEAKQQANMEDITRLALPEVSQEAKPQDVEKDWLADFFAKCRLISNEDMQRLWAKVLAGEANSPGSYSKRTVALLSSLDKSDARLFRNLCSFAWYFGALVPLIYDITANIYLKKGVNFLNLVHLNDIGLLRFDSLAEFGNTAAPQKLGCAYYGTQLGIEFPKPEGNMMQFGHVLLSKTGQQLAPICGSELGLLRKNGQ